MASITALETEAVEPPIVVAPEPYERPLLPGIVPFRLSIAQYMRIAELEILPDDGPGFELLDGVIVAKESKADRVTKGIPHDYAVETLRELLNLLVRPGWFAREEKSLVFGSNWRPEPDVIVLTGTRGDYRQRDPHARDLAIVIEVSISSYAKDRGPKWVGYAEAKVPIYWIVRIDKKCVEVYSRPVGVHENAAYQEMAVYHVGDSIPVHVGGRDVGVIAVDEILS